MNILKNSCLLVIDMQKDFLDDNGYYVHMSANIKPMKDAQTHIEKLLAKINHKIPIIYIRSEYDYEKFGKGKSICVAGTEGCQYALNEELCDVMIVKHEHDSFSVPALSTYLRKKQIKTIILVGVTTEFCIKKTALAAIKRGFKLVVLKDCVGTNMERMKLHYDTLKQIKDAGGIIISSKYFSSNF